MKTKEVSEVYTLKNTIEDFKCDYMKILETQSVTKDTARMMEEIERQLTGIKNITWYKDDFGNLYVTKGSVKGDDKFPAFVCHTDTVHKIRDTYVVCRSVEGNYYAYTEDQNEFQQVGVGGDDKCGIIICLELMHRLKYGKFAFFLDEESGCTGSQAGDLSFFDDCRYAIQIDRKGNGDIITNGNGTDLCSKEFEDLLRQIGKTYMYEPCRGFNTDVVALKKRGLAISACNLSAGYYNPHTKQEYISEIDLIACMEFCLAIARVKTVYPHKLPEPVKTSSVGYKYSPPPTTSSPVTPRKCVLCDGILGASDGRMCLRCVHSNIMLVVEGDKKTLEVRVPKDVINSIKCKQCDTVIVTSFEIDVGLCADCRLDQCYYCNLRLTSQREMMEGVCWHCRNNENAAMGDCDCGEPFTSYAEEQAGMCERCLAYEWAMDSDDDDKEFCSMADCGQTLKSAEERRNTLCNGCVFRAVS